MADDSSDNLKTKVPAASTAQPSQGGIWLLVLACVPYALLVAALPEVGDFPNEGGGEARMAWGFQQFWAYMACGATLILLSLALWRASRAGGISGSVRWTLPILVPAAGAAMAVAMGQSFEQPGPWLPLVPVMVPPAIGLYALWGCLPPLSGWLPRGLSRATIDSVAIGAIAALSLAVLPLWALDDASYPRRLQRHHAEMAAADAAAQAAGEQEDQALRAKFARLGPDSSLRDYIGGEYRYLRGVDVLAGARQVKRRQRDAIAMLDEGANSRPVRPLATRSGTDADALRGLRQGVAGEVRPVRHPLGLGAVELAHRAISQHAMVARTRLRSRRTCRRDRRAAPVDAREPGSIGRGDERFRLRTIRGGASAGRKSRKGGPNSPGFGALGEACPIGVRDDETPYLGPPARTTTAVANLTPPAPAGG